MSETSDNDATSDTSAMSVTDVNSQNDPHQAQSRGPGDHQEDISSTQAHGPDDRDEPLAPLPNHLLVPMSTEEWDARYAPMTYEELLRYDFLNQDKHFTDSPVIKENTATTNCASAPARSENIQKLKDQLARPCWSNIMARTVTPFAKKLRADQAQREKLRRDAMKGDKKQPRTGFNWLAGSNGKLMGRRRLTTQSKTHDRVLETLLEQINRLA